MPSQPPPPGLIIDRGDGDGDDHEDDDDDDDSGSDSDSDGDSDGDDGDGDGDGGTGLLITGFSAPISFVLHSHGEDHDKNNDCGHCHGQAFYILS